MTATTALTAADELLLALSTAYRGLRNASRLSLENEGLLTDDQHSALLKLRGETRSLFAAAARLSNES